MAEMTLDQQKAIAMASARQRAAATTPLDGAPSVSGLANNFAAGTVESATGVPGFIADLGMAQANAESGYNMMPDHGNAPQVGGDMQHYLNQKLEALGLNPENVTANSGMEQLFREGGRFSAAALGGEGGLINRAVRVALPSTGAAIGHEVGGTPGEILGSIIGGGGVPLLERGANLATMSAGDRAQADLMRTLQPSAVDTIAKNTIDRFAGGPVEFDPRQIVPGSRPTMAESMVDNNVGISGLQRTIRDLPGNSPIVQREIANATARNDFLQQLAGTPGDLESATLARDAVTAPMREDAFKGAPPANSKPVDSVIGRILASPAGQRDAVANVMQDIREKLQVENPLSARIKDAIGPIQEQLSKGGISDARRADFMEARRLLLSTARGYTDEDGLVSGLSSLAKNQKIEGPIDNALSAIKSGDTAFESDPEQLYGIRKSITDRLSPLARGTANDARLAAHELQPVLKSLDAAIEQSAPGYKDYMSKFSELSKPIDQMEYLQSLNLVDQRGNITLAKVQNALRNITQQRAASGINQAKSLTDDHIHQLESLRDDLLAGNNINLGRSLGSNTVQNLASEAAIQKIVPGKVGAFVGRNVRPDVIGGTLGGALGSVLPIPGGTVVGAGIGAGIGNVVNHVMQTKNAAVLSRIEDMLLNPDQYQRVSSAPAGLINTSPRALNSITPAIRSGLISSAASSQPSFGKVEAR